MTLLTLGTPSLPQLPLKSQGPCTPQGPLWISPRLFLSSTFSLPFSRFLLLFFLGLLCPALLPQSPPPFLPLSHAWFYRESHDPPLPSLALLGHNEMYLASRVFVINQPLQRLNHFYCSSVNILSFLSLSQILASLELTALSLDTSH